MKYGTSIPLDIGNMPAKFQPHRPPNGELRALNCPGAQFWHSVLIAAKKFWRMSSIFGTYLVLNKGSPDPKRDTSSPTGGVMGPRNLEFYGKV